MTLRVEITDRNERLVFTLTGRIQAEQISELQALLRSKVNGHKVTLDLRNVRLVDRDAVRFLAQCEADGARLRNCSAFIREWVSRERKARREHPTGDQRGMGESVCG